MILYKIKKILFSFVSGIFIIFFFAACNELSIDFNEAEKVSLQYMQDKYNTSFVVTSSKIVSPSFAEKRMSKILHTIRR